MGQASLYYHVETSHKSLIPCIHFRGKHISLHCAPCTHFRQIWNPAFQLPFTACRIILFENELILQNLFFSLDTHVSATFERSLRFCDHIISLLDLFYRLYQTVQQICTFHCSRKHIRNMRRWEVLKLFLKKEDNYCLFYWKSAGRDIFLNNR